MMDPVNTTKGSLLTAFAGWIRVWHFFFPPPRIKKIKNPQQI
jgi:hypothetical protein